MPYTQTVIDNFNDNSLNTSIWNLLSTNGVTEAGGVLRIPSVAAYPQVQSAASHNLTTSILAAKLTRSGTANSGVTTEFYFGVHDGAGNYLQMVSSVSAAAMGIQTYGAATVSNVVIVDTTVGYGPGWTNGMWMGMGNIGSDNIVHLYKSSDGQTWTEMARATVGGTFAKTTTGLYFMAGDYSGTSSTFVTSADDASRWTFTSSGGTTKKMKVRVGNAWAAATPKVRVGGVWVTASPKARSGGVWVSPKQ